jgi:hypothetical protein
MAEAQPPAYPTAEHLQKGPPDPAQEPERARAEKWCRIHAVIPVLRQMEKGPRIEFTTRGPIAVPMAVRRKGSDIGSKDAWIFFTHPWAVFHKDATFWNAPKPPRGVLEARLVESTSHGFKLYDEVGAGFTADRVVHSYPAALGIFRSKHLGTVANDPYTRDLVRLEIDLLELFRLTGLCLQTRSPINAIAEMDRLLTEKNVRAFTQGTFDDQDAALIRQLGALRRGGTFDEATSKFRVDEVHFTRTADVKDGRGQQLVVALAKEWEAFNQTHGATVERLGVEIGRCESEVRRIALQIEHEKDEHATENKITRFLTGRVKAMKKLEDERTALQAREKELRAEFDAIPGYDRLNGLTEQIESFKKVVDGVRRLATNIFDHNVTQQHVKALEELLAKMASGEPSAWKDYDRRLRAEVFPRLFTAQSISAYVLRRPDSLSGGLSLKNVKRINRMALDAIDYFREAKLGAKTLGQVYDETWGQIEQLEARI